MTKQKIQFLFTDLGGVLLTNGWDHKSREKAIKTFDLDEKEFESRHQLFFGDYEIGKVDLKTYLRYTVFFKPRSFSYEDFEEFMYAQSQPLPGMIEYVKQLKEQYHLKLVAVSNEGKELTEHRIKKFGLDSFIDVFVVSCFIGTRKPDIYMWKLALNLVQAHPENVLYIEDRKLFVEIASELGINSIWHQDLASTSKAVSQLSIDSHSRRNHT